MREIKLKYLCKSFSNAIAAKELNSEATNGYPVYGAAGLMGYKDSYDTDVEYLGIVKDGAGVGRINVYPAKSSLLGTMATIIPNNNVDIKWLQYAISNLNLGESVDKATIPHIYFSVYGNSYIRDISISTQQKIAAHLDRKSTQIDALISNAQQQIEKLKAYKQSVITETVTKGLDPDVKMKDSGVEWIGEIPEHWDFRKAFFVYDKIGDIDHYMPESIQEGIPYVMTGDLKSNASEIEFEKCKQVSRADYDTLSKKITVNIGDIIFARYATIGTVCYVDIDNEFIVSYSCLVIKPNSLIHGKYLYYYYQSHSFFEEVKRVINSNTQANVGLDAMTKVRIICPELAEQQAIADYLDRKCSQIDKLIDLKQQKIEKLQKYKKSLIYEYVTGKKEV